MNNVSRTQSIIWGGLLIVFGLMGLADAYFDLTVWTWAAVLAATGGAVFLVYLTERRESWPLIPAYALLMTATLLALIELGWLNDPFIATFVLGVIAFPFLFVFFQDRSKWWALIPAYVLLSIAIMIPLVENELLQDSFVATYVLSTIALPFLIIYFRDRQNWWALIPAYTLLAIGIMVGLIEMNILVDLVIPAYIMFVIAIPFLYIYIRQPNEWWPLIPGGIMSFMGLAFLFSARSTRFVVPLVLIAGGVAILIRQFLRPSADEG